MLIILRVSVPRHIGISKMRNHLRILRRMINRYTFIFFLNIRLVTYLEAWNNYVRIFDAAHESHEPLVFYLISFCSCFNYLLTVNLFLFLMQLHGKTSFLNEHDHLYLNLQFNYATWEQVPTGLRMCVARSEISSICFISSVHFHCFLLVQRTFRYFKFTRLHIG